MIKKINRYEKLIFETKYWTIELASDQTYLGRCKIILKRKCGELNKVNNKEWDDFLKVIKRMENGLKIAFNATMFNWTCLMNDAYQSKNPMPQVHWHFRPRYKNKIKFNGLFFEDKEFGQHYNREKNRKIAERIQNKIIEKIRKSVKLK